MNGDAGARRMRLVAGTAIAVCLAGVMSAAHGQASFPNRPVRIVVGFLAGGPVDIVARLMAPRLSEALGQPVIVDNRPGAGGALGTEQVAKSPADGHTVLMGAIGSLAVAPSLVPGLGYDTLRDLEPVTHTVTVTNFLVVSAFSPVKSLGELLEAARAKPGTLTYASTGNGTGPWLAAELMKSLGKVDIVHVPYKGTPATTSAMLRGEVDVGFENSLVVLPHVNAGKLRALAVTSGRRSALMPELPTMSEAGLPGYQASGWYGLMVPKGTPGAVVERLHAESVKALRVPDVVEKLRGQGAEPVGSTPVEFGALIASEIDKWGRLIRSAGLRAQ